MELLHRKVSRPLQCIFKIVFTSLLGHTYSTTLDRLLSIANSEKFCKGKKISATKYLQPNICNHCIAKLPENCTGKKATRFLVV